MNMKISIPALDNKYCRGMTICAKVKNPTKSLLKHIALNSAQEMTCVTSSARIPKLLRTIWGGSSESHVHIDLVKTSSAKWQKSTTKKELEIALTPVMGFDMDMELYGSYWIPASLLPAEGIIHACFFEIDDKELGVQISLTSGEITIHAQSFTQKIHWLKQSEHLHIELTSRHNDIFNQYYISKAALHLDTTFNTLVLGNSKIKST